MIINVELKTDESQRFCQIVKLKASSVIPTIWYMHRVQINACIHSVGVYVVMYMYICM